MEFMSRFFAKAIRQRSEAGLSCFALLLETEAAGSP